MSADILKSFSALQNDLDSARNSLKGVDENIKRLLGRDPSEFQAGRQQVSAVKRNIQNDKGRNKLNGADEKNNGVRGNRSRPRPFDNDEPPSKRRAGISVFKRLSERIERPNDKEHNLAQKQMISKVIVTKKEVPSRQEALEAQSRDEQSKARNRRMFGALLGTLAKFQQEETKLKNKEEKRAQVEKKIEEHEIKEKEEIKKERQELFMNRKKKQAEIKMIELKMLRMKEYVSWEEMQKSRLNFIQTKTKPQIHYLPRKLNDATKKILDESKTEIQKLIDEKCKLVNEELAHIEERMKRNFESRNYIKTENISNQDKDIEENEEDELLEEAYFKTERQSEELENIAGDSENLDNLVQEQQNIIENLTSPSLNSTNILEPVTVTSENVHSLSEMKVEQSDSNEIVGQED